MTGEHETSVTYPQFFRLADGDLLFLYRDGASGRGLLILNRFTATTAKWTAVQPNLIDGEGKRSLYWSMTVDNKGGRHIACNWRESPDVASNHDLCYARSVDGGRTWPRSDGAPLALPITAATAENAARIPINSNLMNPPSVVADNRGHPLIVSYWSRNKEGAPQFQIGRHDGKSWQTIAGPSRNGFFPLAGPGTKNPPISRAALFVELVRGSSVLHLIYRDDTRGGRIVAASLPGEAHATWIEMDLTDSELLVNRRQGWNQIVAGGYTDKLTRKSTRIITWENFMASCFHCYSLWRFKLFRQTLWRRKMVRA
jgi:hypothetical protein